MKRLPDVFVKRGFTYTLLRSFDVWRIYELSTEGIVYGYEVVKIREMSERIINNVVIEAREVLPSDEQFGYIGFSYNNLANAENKFKEVTE